jgi:peptidoglycan-N-acetylglucosamine deacetylase
MKNLNLLIILFLFIFTPGITISYAQNYQDGNDNAPAEFSWPQGKKMALSLTFDDARLSQADAGLPLFDKYDVKATFYVSPNAMIQRLDVWKNAVSNGHEIGNHSLYHPCSGNFPWARNRALEDYTIEGMKAELDSAGRFINHFLGVQPVSFAYPCGQTFVGKGINTKSYIPVVAKLFETGRGWLDEAPNDPAYCDFARLHGMELDGKSFGEILTLIESARERGFWLILAGHEIGRDGRQTSFIDTIEKILKYSQDPSNGIWIDNVKNIASYIREQREN